MGFDLGSVKSIGVPAWLRGLVCTIALLAIAGDLAIGWTGLRNQNHKEWFTAAVQAGAALIPLMLAALVLAFSTTGTETLTRKTGHLLTHLIPSMLPYAATPVPQFANARLAKNRGRPPNQTLVDVAYHPGDFYCRYRITFPDVWSNTKTVRRRTAYLIIDLKVYGANMHLCVPREELDQYVKTSQAANRSMALREAFRATLFGAETAGCKVNENAVDLDLDQQSLTCLVAVRTLSPTFLSDPEEQLYLAQDLVAMLRGFWRERIEWFPFANEG
jgi:hypothetical protein